MALVKSAFDNVNGNLSDIQLFHTDKGFECKNQAIDEALDAFKINAYLGKKDARMIMLFRSDI